MQGAPISDVGGPYTVDEGDEVRLAPIATDPEGDALSWAWDLDGDLAYDDSTASEVTGRRAGSTVRPRASPSGRRRHDGDFEVTASIPVNVRNVGPQFLSTPPDLRGRRAASGCTRWRSSIPATTRSRSSWTRRTRTCRAGMVLDPLTQTLTWTPTVRQPRRGHLHVPRDGGGRRSRSRAPGDHRHGASRTARRPCRRSRTRRAPTARRSSRRRRPSSSRTWTIRTATRSSTSSRSTRTSASARPTYQSSPALARRRAGDAVAGAHAAHARRPAPARPAASVLRPALAQRRPERSPEDGSLSTFTFAPGAEPEPEPEPRDGRRRRARAARAGTAGGGTRRRGWPRAGRPRRWRSRPGRRRRRLIAAICASPGGPLPGSGAVRCDRAENLRAEWYPGLLHPREFARRLRR